MSRKLKLINYTLKKSQQFNIIHLLFTITQGTQSLQNPKLGEILRGCKIMILSHLP